MLLLRMNRHYIVKILNYIVLDFREWSKIKGRVIEFVIIELSHTQTNAVPLYYY